jgi:hypothetical protein
MTDDARKKANDRARRARAAARMREQIIAEGQHHAATGIEGKTLDGHAPPLIAEPGRAELRGAVNFAIYWSAYTRALAERYLTDAGVSHVLEAARRPTMHASFTTEAERVAYDAATFARADGTMAPTPEEWIAALRADRYEAHTLGALIVGLQSFDTDARVVEAERAAADARGKQREAEDRAREAEEALARRRPALRQGTGFLRATIQREEHVSNARKTMQMAVKLDPAQVEARRGFVYEPLGWAERLVVHALAAIAREEKLLDVHPVALSARYDDTTPAPRVRVPFPGYAELARIARFESDGSNRMPKETRKTMERALISLTKRPRWIAEPVRVKVGKGYIDDVRVTQTLWVEASTTLLTHRTELNLHPVAFASHLHSYIPVDDLAARYAAARKAIGKAKMLDEYAACDDYLRYQASVKLGQARGAGAKIARSSGASRDEVKAAGHHAVGDMVVAGDLAVTCDLKDSTLRDAIGMRDVARDRGETVARQRLEDALRFAQAMGTLRSYQPTESSDGKPMWRLVLAHPAVHGGAVDPDQGVIFVPDDDPELTAAP